MIFRQQITSAAIELSTIGNIKERSPEFCGNFKVPTVCNKSGFKRAALTRLRQPDSGKSSVKLNLYIIIVWRNVKLSSCCIPNLVDEKKCIHMLRKHYFLVQYKSNMCNRLFRLLFSYVRLLSILQRHLLLHLPFTWCTV